MQAFHHLLTEEQIKKNQFGEYNQLKVCEREIKSSLHILEFREEKQKHNREKSCIQNYLKILEIMSNQLLEAKNRYNSIDKNALIEQKCLEFAKQIKVYRDQSYFLSNQLKNLNKQLTRKKQRTNTLQRDIQCLQASVKKKQKQSMSTKTFYITSSQPEPFDTSRTHLVNTAKITSGNETSYDQWKQYSIKESPAVRLSKVRGISARTRAKEMKQTQIREADNTIDNYWAEA